MVEHRDEAKGSLAELSSGTVYQLVLNPWQKFPSWAGLELAILLPRPSSGITVVITWPNLIVWFQCFVLFF